MDLPRPAPGRVNSKSPGDVLARGRYPKGGAPPYGAPGGPQGRLGRSRRPRRDVPQGIQRGIVTRRAETRMAGLREAQPSRARSRP